MHDRPDDDEKSRAPLIPLVPQPRGAALLLGTWTGRIIVINSIMFLVTLYLSGLAWSNFQMALLSSNTDVLLKLGAKDNTLLALGEYWRLLTPLFIHGGLIHFAFNTYGLYVVSYQFEYLLGSRSFLILYLASGMTGNIASVLAGPSVSVGASGALFGLLGFGLYLERVVQSRIEAMTGRRPRAGAYTVMAIANIILGFLIPQIDNSAHLGGLAFGVIFAYIWLRYIPNRLMPLRQKQARVATVLLLLVLGVGAWLGSSRWYVLYQLQGAIQSADRVEVRYIYLNRLVALESQNAQYRLHRLKLALVLRDYPMARLDLIFMQAEPGAEIRLQELETELLQGGFVDSAAWLRRTRQDVPLGL
ncbi:MAG TPA: rhomboid family intramembrane serine protease [Oligoflexus sp.]|uniref:rhomboid family intramembrane serine protease n=1 Tax=Oligoflexus sp. TaxID=1971216 RepID=UPI002D6EF7FA|nr:rhomboid family intramembrane serine protease [Oligoflexus sp.]HYX39444.1 rhomboid family intramembrane serine protease [Oligoflexus sp.]